MVDAKVISFGLVSFVIVLMIGCVGMGHVKVPANAIAVLNEAIDSLDAHFSKCEVSEFSTEDGEVLEALRTRDFDVIEYEMEVEGEEVEHHFIVRQPGSGLLLSLEVVAVDDECSSFTFGRIVQDALSPPSHQTHP